MLVKNGVDATSVEGAATLPYAIPNSPSTCTREDRGARAVVALGRLDATAFRNTECSSRGRARTKEGPFHRAARSSQKKAPRHKGCSSSRAAGGLGQAAPEGRRAASRCTSRSILRRPGGGDLEEKGRLPQLERVVCAVDCGGAVNPTSCHADGVGHRLRPLRRADGASR